jgi:hypothetical protein
MVEGVLVNDVDDVCIRMVPPVKSGPEDQPSPSPSLVSSLAEFIDLIEASFEEFHPERLMIPWVPVCIIGRYRKMFSS